MFDLLLCPAFEFVFGEFVGGILCHVFAAMFPADFGAKGEADEGDEFGQGFHGASCFWGVR